jgi:hypothetical protein
MTDLSALFSGVRHNDQWPTSYGEHPKWWQFTDDQLYNLCHRRFGVYLSWATRRQLVRLLDRRAA